MKAHTGSGKVFPLDLSNGVICNKNTGMVCKVVCRLVGMQCKCICKLYEWSTSILLDMLRLMVLPEEVFPFN